MKMCRAKRIALGGVAVFALLMALAALNWQGSHPPSQRPAEPADAEPGQLAGSASCRKCHEQFYELWIDSHHGLAMQPYTAELARTKLIVQTNDVQIGEHRYRVDVSGQTGWVREHGPGGEASYRIQHVMGGKNVYYFLTPMERGRLQVLPVAFDAQQKVWFDTTASAVRHFDDQRDEALHWTERPLTFNTACYSCHVSQLTSSYDLETDTYRTVWAEPGINCETCHGPAADHIRVCEQAPKGQPPEDLKIIITRNFNIDQKNALCAPCHAKMMPLTTAYNPGDRYFDNFDLSALEDPDFYPDGRDLGENYTYTLWLTSPCAESGRLDCLHCHTSSGRYRFSGDQANNACMPCHKQNVENAAAHSHHPAGKPGSRCVDCHMPKTMFARMQRSDHSMRPPIPAATLAFKSPNACNLCHEDKDAAWADQHVRAWHQRDYQAPALDLAGLIDAARKRDWRRLPDILAYLERNDHNQIYAASLIRLLADCDNESKWPVLRKLLADESPLVRSSAVEAMRANLVPEIIKDLVKAARDEYRLVRIRSASVLAAVPPELYSDQDRTNLERAMAEFESAMRRRPDDFASHYNLGNFYMNRNELKRAVASFETALKLRPDGVAPLVNVSMAYARLGQNDLAERSLRKALSISPTNAAASFNLGLLLAEQGKTQQAETLLRAALKAEPQMAAAAYNLGVLLAADRLAEAIQWCGKAAQLRPQEPKYAYALAVYLQQSGDLAGAIRVLHELVGRHPGYAEAHLLLGQVYWQDGNSQKAAEVYRRALDMQSLSQRDRYLIQSRLQALMMR